VAPVYFEPLCAELKKLSRTLGENHDLDVLSSRLEILPGRQDRRLLQTLIQKRQQKLQSMAFLLGKQLYGEKPSAFCRCVEELWLAWQPHPVKKRISHKNKTGKK
jgi:CHAD domain-containing protein